MTTNRLTDEQLDDLEAETPATVHLQDIKSLLTEVRERRQEQAAHTAVVAKMVELGEQQEHDYRRTRALEAEIASAKIDRSLGSLGSTARLPTIVDLQDTFGDGAWLSPKRTRDMYAKACARIVDECSAVASCTNEHAGANPENRTHSHEELEDAHNLCHANLSRIFLMYSPADDDGGDDARRHTLPWERGLMITWARWMDAVVVDAGNAVLAAASEYVEVKGAGENVRRIIRRRDHDRSWRLQTVATSE